MIKRSGARFPDVCQLFSLSGSVMAVCLVLALLTGIIHFMATDGKLMTREMEQFAPPERTGIPAVEYHALGAHIADYLAGRKDDFQYTLRLESGESVPCFHDYELIHMADCRNLIRLDGIVSIISLAVVLGGALWTVFADKDRKRAMLSGMRKGLWFLGMVAAGLTLWAVVNFDGLFVTFHRIAFRNDYWLLNPRTDLLIRLMPETMFIDLGIKGLAVFTAGLALLLMALWAIRRRSRNDLS